MGHIEYSAGELEPLILYADNHLLVVNKLPGLLTQDSGTGRRNLEDWAREWIRHEKSKPGKVFLNAVHRIDRPVSGVVLFARTSKALSRLNEDIRQHTCRKIYHALVGQHPPEPAARLEHWLRHDQHCAALCMEGDPGARRAVLHYKTIGRMADLTLLEVELETGRYHQIRAQLAAAGCPVAGDRKYGDVQSEVNSGIALHHRMLQITHPTSRESKTFTAPYPVGSAWWSRHPSV